MSRPMSSESYILYKTNLNKCGFENMKVKMTISLCDLLYDDTCYGFDNLHGYRAKQLRRMCSFQSFAHQNLLAVLLWLNSLQNS